MNSKPVLVLLHAFPLSSRMWAAQKKALSSVARVLAPDLPGFGASKPVRGIKIAGMADRVAAELDRLGVEGPVTVAGLSMGGYVALEFVRRYPKRVRALGLFATRAGADSAEQKKKRFEAVRTVRKKGVRPLALAMLPKLLAPITMKDRPRTAAAAKRLMLGASRDGVIGALRALAGRRDNIGSLSRIPCPALIVAGAADAVIPLEEMKLLAKKIRRSEFHVLPRAGHLLNLERPDRFNALLVRFVRSRT